MTDKQDANASLLFWAARLSLPTRQIPLFQSIDRLVQYGIGIAGYLSWENTHARKGRQK